MNSHTLLEFIGYTASLIIAVSLMMKSLIRLRIINGIGALFFVAYGLLISAYPVALLNVLIVLIDGYYLMKMLKRSEYFSLMEVTPNSQYLNFFLSFHREDIENFFPNFDYIPNRGDLILFILRDTIPAGVVIISPDGNSGKILPDYALKDFRDFKIGGFIFDDHVAVLRESGIETLQTTSKVPSHTRYLKQMGFVNTKDDHYKKDLTTNLIRDRKF